MPRAKKSANPHNTRHENGVVAPGKRITKQKSTSHLNGTPEGKLGGNTPPIPQSPTHGLSYPQHLPTSNGNGTTLKGVHGTVAQHERAKNTFDPSSNDTEDYSSPNGKMAGELYHRKIDVNAVKIATHQDGGGMVHLALTVLRSCPRRDTLAILIFLLSIPPNILSLTNAAFAILTFVPPSGSFTSIPTLSDITSSSSPGAPSFTVMCLIDFIAFILWHFLHPILQSVILDCAQAMVATTLGGGYTHRPGVSDNTGLCLGVVAVTSVSRYKQIVLYRLHRSWIGRWIALFISLDSSYIPQTYSRNLNRTWWDTVTVLVALHIVCQGMTRNVRRHLYSSRNSSSVPTVRAVDPEAVVGAQAGFEGSEPIHNTPTSPTELKSRSSLQNIREIRDKVSSGKRRRKQGNYVRSQQPLWAAFAATKATIMREYEQSQATNDALVSNAKDAQNLGSAPFATEDNHIWITVVHSSSFCFETSPWAPNRLFTRGRDLSCINDSAGLKKLTPFYVRINGADWASVKIYAVPDTEDDRGRPYWTGEVYGLSPANTYQVTFTRCEDAAVVHSEIIATPASSISASEQGKQSIQSTILNAYIC